MAHDPSLFGRDALALASAVARYWPRIWRVTNNELGRCRQLALTIPDPTLRRHALDKLDGQRANALAAATFATLVTRRSRLRAARLMVAFQVMYDYLDALTEQPVEAPLQNGRQLHRSLLDVFSESEPQVDYYEHHPQRDDRGYLAGLSATCRARFRQLASHAAVRDVAITAVARCAESQTRTHAIPVLGTEQLGEWALTDQVAADGYQWWELAAGAASSLTVHALLALAASPAATRVDAVRVDAVYYPAISGLSTLLDSFADYDTDDSETDHRYIAYYSTMAAAADRLGEIAAAGGTAARCLPNGSRHMVIVAGIACFYLAGDRGAGEDTAESILTRVGPIARPITTVLNTLSILHADRGRA